MHTVDHARAPQIIGINLNQFLEEAVQRKQFLSSITILRRLLKGGQRHKYITTKSVNSAVNERLNKATPNMRKPLTVKCMIFQRGKENE